MQGWIFFRKAAISSGNNFTYLRFGEGFEVMDKKKLKKIKKKKRKKKKRILKKKKTCVPSPLGFFAFTTGEGLFFPLLLGKEFSSLSHSGRSLLYFPAVAGEGIFFPLLLGKEFSSLYYWGKNFLPFRTTEGVFFTSPLWLGKEFPSLLTGEGIFFSSYWGRKSPLETVSQDIKLTKTLELPRALPPGPPPGALPLDPTPLGASSLRSLAYSHKIGEEMGKLYGHRTVASGKKFALLEEYSPLPRCIL